MNLRRQDQQRSQTHQPRLLASAISLALASFAGAAVAAPESRAGQVKLGDVHVEGTREQGYKVDHSSSPRATAALRDTPQTVNVVPERLFREQNARTLTDVLKNTPGISFEAGENGFATSANNFSMRGFDASGSIFVDGVRDNGSYTRDVFNLEQVEVAKGPAADNGRGGPGGYINQVTKAPTLESFLAGGISYGFDRYDSEARKRLTLDTNQRINASTAVRLNLLLEDSGVAGREHAEKNSWGIAPSVAFGLGTDTRLSLAYEHVEMNDRPDLGVAGVAYRDKLKGANTPVDPRAWSADRDAYFGLKSDFDDTTTDAVVLRLEHDLSNGVTLSNQTRWARVDRQARYTHVLDDDGNAAAELINTQRQQYDRVNTSLSNLTNLSAGFEALGFQHTVATGLELTREKSESLGYQSQTLPGLVSVLDPNWRRAVPAPLAARDVTDVKVDTVAVYLYDTIEFNPQWQLTAGLRLEEFRASVDNKRLTGEVLTNYDDTELGLSGKIGLVYKPVESGSIYASYGVSNAPLPYLSNSDISRTDQGLPALIDGADPVRAHNYELGTKWDLFDERLSTTAALFYIKKEKVAITGRDPGEVVTTLKGYGEQVVKGLELSASGKLTDNWNLYGGILFMDSERKHSAYLDSVRQRANAGDYGPGVNRTDGDELAFTPRVSGNLWTTYRLPVGLTFGLGAQHVGSSYLGRPDNVERIVANGRYGKVPSYTTFAAMATYEVSENVDVRLNIDNLTNEEYISSANWQGRRVMLGDPRTFTLSSNFRF